MIEAYLDQIRDHFYDQLDQTTSAWLFGSALTGNWVPGRSDLDLYIVVPKERLASFGAKVRAWARIPANPILDGYVLASSESSPMIMPLERFAIVASPSTIHIELIDQWYIKNRSKHLFGPEPLQRDLSDISIDNLRRWALSKLQMLANGTASDRRPTLSDLIWTTSWAARMLMLARGNVCESKLEALKWLANENEEIRDVVGLLLADFYKSDDLPISMTPEQSLVLSRFCIELARLEIQP
ncbi:nucleotidyltransferase domain-containing protein [Bdellovibrio bacteriovorus]|uniref:nucleotidyltransferase domain-containing protein n=1 Tax=Bdellovibrio bacteriovorus TaxID=959 RepID=UPI0035A61528